MNIFFVSKIFRFYYTTVTSNAACRWNNLDNNNDNYLVEILCYCLPLVEISPIGMYHYLPFTEQYE